MIPFNVPPQTGHELDCIAQAIAAQKICGDGAFTKKCSRWLEENFHTPRTLLTTSCTHALELAAMLCDIQPGDEVLMPSYTFVSTANAFVLRGAKIVFVDIRPDTMNMDERHIEELITPRTKVIVPVHYAGVSCEMDVILSLAQRYHLLVVEDAAQGVMSSYQGKALGTIGDLGCYSFHETKNYSMGEGGALLINRPDWIERAEILREKGTNRSRFLSGQVDKYTWVDCGSSYLSSELNAAYLYPQLEDAVKINEARLACWDAYKKLLTSLAQEGRIEIPYVPENCVHNAHMFYIKAKDLEERTALITFLKEQGVDARFHYVPLHSAPAGQRYGVYSSMAITERESERLLRLPLYYGLTMKEVEQVVQAIEKYFSLSHSGRLALVR